MQAIRSAIAGKPWIPSEVAVGMAEHCAGDRLSVRGTEVLRKVAAGCSNKMVADQLNITEDTVKGHMKSILSKLQANDRTHAVLIAMKRGFLEG